jgi:hypothetical protein
MTNVKLTKLDYQMLIEVAKKNRKKPDEMLSELIREKWNYGK